MVIVTILVHHICKSHKMRHMAYWTVCLLLFIGIPKANCDNESSSANSTLTFVKELPIVIKQSGDYMRLRCEVEGYPPATQFKWMKNGVSFSEERNRVKVKTKIRGKGRGTQWSQLRFKELQTSDTGNYTCKVTNGIDTIVSIAVIKVSPQSGGKSMQENGWEDYNSIDQDEGLLPESYSMPDISGFVESKEGQTPGDKRGGNKHRADPKPENRKLYQKMPTLKADGIKGSCQPYVGSVCAKFLGQEDIFVSEGLHQENVEQKLLTTISVISASPDLTQECSLYAIPTICLSTFPLCDHKAESPRKLCREECEVLESQICHKELAMARQVVDKHVILPECLELPPVGSPESANCMRLGIPKVSNLIKPHKCYKGDGGSYRGTISTTESGHLCQPWNRNSHLEVGFCCSSLLFLERKLLLMLMLLICMLGKPDLFTLYQFAKSGQHL